MPKITLILPLYQPTINSKKMKLKLAKQVKKEPRKGSFPWDLGFLFVQPMKYALISGFIFYNSK